MFLMLEILNREGKKPHIKAIVSKLVLNMGSSANTKFLTRRAMADFQKAGLTDCESLPNPLIS